MKRKIYIWILSLCLSIGAITGCASNTVQEDNDTCITVELPENKKIKNIFKFNSTTDTNLTGGEAVGVPDGNYTYGMLKNGNSVVWRSNNESRFVYVQGEASDFQIIHYAKELYSDAISYDEFKEIYDK